MSWPGTVGALLARVGYVIHRWPNNRFDGMADSLELLRRARYRPRVVIDCGANVGQWARLSSAVFPEAEYHLVEPQAFCWKALDAFARERGGVHVHRTAVTEPRIAHVRMLGGGGVGCTGNFVALSGERSEDEIECPATTLDALFAERISPDARLFLKLDIEGHEMAALRGASRLLEAVEVVLTEVHFFDVFHAGRPLFSDVLAFLAAHEFELYDFACLATRPRDYRLRMGDALFVRRSSPLAADVSWD